MELTKTKFKKTEVGWIPEDWEVFPLESCFSYISYGFTNPMPESNSGIFLLTARDIYNGKINYSTARKTHVWAYEKLLTNKSRPKEGDLLLTKDGTLGRLAIVDNKKVCINQSIAVIRTNHRVFNRFLQKLLESNRYQKVMLENAGGSTIKHIYITIVNKMPIGIPPSLTEQKAIATALSDVDELIAKLEKLIEKKKAIKQGAMQALLTPKKDWIKKRISEIAEVGRGRVISHKEINSSIDNSYPVYSSQTSNDGVMGYIGTFDFEGEYVTWTTDGVNAGTVFYRNGKFNCTNVCGTLKLKRDNPRFIAVCLNEITPKFVSRNLANPKLMNDVMKKIELVLPESIEEQNLIADRFSFINSEIELLNKKYLKLLFLKQGMMQELLTGRTRLV
jgi:type I restriction enzyme S subunit